MDYLILPKIELHLHLDCSLSYNLVQKLNADISYEKYRGAFIAPAKCKNLSDYLTRAVNGIDLMQTGEALRLTTLDLFEQLKSDNVIYAEIRFAPLEHLSKGLTGKQVVDVVNDAVRIGIQETGVQAGIILCTLRHYSKKQSLETVKLVEHFKNTNVVGFDIAADEGKFSIKNHIPAFEYAREQGLNFTAHAGEARGPESVWETMKYFSPKRIGHGVRSAEDPNLLEFLREQNVHLEVCPTSNIQTNVYSTIENHTIDRLLRFGISVGINTDARTISDVTLADEYQTLCRTFNWGKEELLQCNLAALKHAFTSDNVKSDLRSRILAGFGLETV